MRSIVITHRVVVVAVLLAALSGCKRGSNSAATSDASTALRSWPAVARVGTPTLSPAVATIGPKGGTLTSADGKLSLSIPAGAFANDTEVRIQPTANAPEEAAGPVYQLSPEGVTFPQPATLTWHLSDDDLAKNSIANLNVATQASDGKWEVQPSVQRDEATHSVSVSTSHFSLWALLQTLRIAPFETKIFAGESVLLQAAVGSGFPFSHEMPPAPDQGDNPPAPPSTAHGGDKDGDLLAPPASKTQSRDKDGDLLAPPAPKTQSRDKDGNLLAPPERAKPENTADMAFWLFRNAVWRVNGKEGGDASVGTIKRGYQEMWAEAHYQAPASLASPMTVTVSLEANVDSHKMIATALVTVLPFKRHWVGSSEITQLDGGRVSSGFTFAEVVQPGRTVSHWEVLNGTVKWYPPKGASNCDLTITPTVHNIAPKEGNMTADADNLGRWIITGGGQSVWLATYTNHCPNGSMSFPSSVSAAWWPVNASPMGAIPIQFDPHKTTSVTIDVNGMFGHGTVRLVPKLVPE